MTDPAVVKTSVGPIPFLQATVLLAVIASATVLGVRGTIDAAAVTAILGGIGGSVGVLAGVSMGRTTAAKNGTAVSS